ncbi:MAG: hypothetical protein F6K31_20130 [Symploca sp. SIO2G7]|nr:hypothetical protein [Symploca sp. SIO2G7]
MLTEKKEPLNYNGVVALALICCGAIAGFVVAMTALILKAETVIATSGIFLVITAIGHGASLCSPFDKK